MALKAERVSGGAQYQRARGLLGVCTWRCSRGGVVLEVLAGSSAVVECALCSGGGGRSISVEPRPYPWGATVGRGGSARGWPPILPPRRSSAQVCCGVPRTFAALARAVRAGGEGGEGRTEGQTDGQTKAVVDLVPDVLQPGRKDSLLWVRDGDSTLRVAVQASGSE